MLQLHWKGEQGYGCRYLQQVEGMMSTSKGENQREMARKGDEGVGEVRK